MNSATQFLQRPSAALDTEAEMLPQDPPPKVVRWIAVLLLTMFFFAVIAVVVVRVPETIRSPFVLISEKGADPIQAPLLAVVQAVQIEEGTEVEAGAVLFVLRSDEIRNWQTQWQNDREDLKALRERAQKSEASFESQLSIKKEEIAQVEQELVFRGKHAEFSKGYARRMEDLFKSGLISEVELLKAQLDLAQSDKDVSVTEKSRQQAFLDRQRLEAERSRQRTDEQAEENKLQARLEALARQLENCQGDLWRVRAPYHAVVISMAQRSVGNVVQSGQQLCELSAVEGKPRARLLLRQEGLSQVSAHQRVRLFFDAFPYHRYGTVAGKLDWISPAAVTSSTGAHFVALASLEQVTLMVQKQPRPLQVGMKGEARVSIGQRTLLEYAFDPLKGVREHLSQ